MIMFPDRAAGADAAVDREVLERCIRARVEEIHPAMRPASVRIRTVREQHRPNASLYEVDLQDRDASMSLLIKVPVVAPADTASRPAHRPRLVDQPDATLSRRLEHAALAAIREHFGALGDARFGAIRVFDGVAPPAALIMERLHQPSLRSLLMQARRWSRGGEESRLLRAMENTGAWLRRYHEMAPGEHAASRHTRRVEVVAMCGAIAEWLGARVGEEPFMREAAAAFAAAAQRVLPDALPLGLSHGDFALRNVLVGSGERITVCDTRSRWVTAVYEDVGHFLAWLRWSWPQLYSFGLAFDPALLSRCETAFIGGYFATPDPPAGALRLYRLLALLDRLAGEVSRGTSGEGWISAGRGRLKVALLMRAIRTEVREIRDTQG